MAVPFSTTGRTDPMARKTTPQIRQGDVLLLPVKAVPDGAAPVPPEDGRVVLARGEATLHHHSFAHGRGAALFREDGAGGGLYLMVTQAPPGVAADARRVAALVRPVQDALRAALAAAEAACAASGVNLDADQEGGRRPGEQSPFEGVLGAIQDALAHPALRALATAAIDTPLEHQEHDALAVPPGAYRVVGQMEWTDDHEPIRVSD